MCHALDRLWPSGCYLVLMAQPSPGQRVRTAPDYPAPWAGKHGVVRWVADGNVRVDLDGGDSVTCGPLELELLGPVYRAVDWEPIELSPVRSEPMELPPVVEPGIDDDAG